MSSSPIEEIKNRLDIVEIIGNYVKLEKAGANYRGICPFHSEKTPSFFVSPSRQIWHCFGSCSTGGDIFKFIMKIEGVEFGDALRILAKKAGVELKREDPKLKTERQRFYEISEIACKFFETQLEESSSGKKAKEYLFKRGVRAESIEKWRLGYAPNVWQGLSDFLVGQGYKREEAEKVGLTLKSQKTGNYYDRFRGRIIFPIFNLSSQVVGFGGRIFNTDNQEEAKYINSPGTALYDKSRILYGLHRANMSIRKENACILVEGYMDVIMAHQEGLENSVAVSGTALTPFHLKILKRYSNNIFTAFDMDVAGNSATKRGIDMAQSLGFNIKIVEMPQEMDPADIALKYPKKMKNLVRKAKSIHDFYFDSVLSEVDKDSLEGKKKIAEVLLPVIKRIPNKIEQALWVKDMADVLGVREEYVTEELTKISLGKLNRATDEEKIKKTAKQTKRQKTRKELLEEYLIVLAIKSPENVNLLQEKDFNFFSLKITQIINHIKEKGLKLSDDLPVELKDAFNYFFLKADIEKVEGDKIEEEFKNCLKEIRKLALREKLNIISQKIKKAEQEKDFEKANKLVREFNQSFKLAVWE